ncbi:MAG TPA: YfjI family protein, partial [bacterium]|nr:YfjI family protein [bacterium]
RKSPVFNAMTAPLAEWEQAEAERLQPDIDRITTERNVLQDRIKRLQSDAANAEDPGERKRLIDEICCLKEELPAALITPRLWTSDCTPERLQNLLLDHGESMSLLSDEGGIFEILSGLYNDGRVNLDVFLQAHAGSPVRVDRQTRTVCLNAPALTLGLAVQPEILREMNRGSKRRFRGIGALARFLYAIPPSNIGSRDIFKQIPIPAQVSSEYSRRVKSLINIPTPEYPNVLSLDGKALEAWKTFSQFIESNQGNGKTYESIQDWTGKLPGAALRIAGNFHVAEYGEGNPTIGLHTMENALDLSNLLIEHAQAAFGTMETDPVIEDAQLIFKWIVANGRERFSKHECHRAVRGKVHKVERLEKGLGELTGRGYISSPDREPTPGRPRITYTVNPKIMKGGK